MARPPSISHQVLVDYVLGGHTTREAKAHFSFRSDNVANLRIHAAFKALGIERPRYSEERTCQYCGRQFLARDLKQRTCGAQACQAALILDWQSQNPAKVRKALQDYRGTEKGRQNNIRMHRRRRDRGLGGVASDRWNFAATEIKKSLRKLHYLAIRNPWEYRLQHIQQAAQLKRQFTPRNPRSVHASSAQGMWQIALRAAQTTVLQRTAAASSSVWEQAVNRIGGSLRTGNKVREWKRTNAARRFRSIT